MLNIKGAQISHETPGIGKKNSESFEIFSCDRGHDGAFNERGDMHF
jgi:hypothetical protein